MDKNFIIELPELEVVEAKNDLLRLTEMTKDIFLKVNKAFSHQKTEPDFLDTINEDSQNIKTFETNLADYLSTVYQEHPSAETSLVLIHMTRISSDLKEAASSCRSLAALVNQKSENRSVSDQQTYRVLNKIFEHLLETFEFILKDINQRSKTNIEKHIILKETINQQKNHLRMLQLSKVENIDLEKELLITDFTNNLTVLSAQLFRITSVLSNKKGSTW